MPASCLKVSRWRLEFCRGACFHRSSSSWSLTWSWRSLQQVGTTVYSGHGWTSLMTWWSCHTIKAKCRTRHSPGGYIGKDRAQDQQEEDRADEDEHNCQHTSHSCWRAHQGGGVFCLLGSMVDQQGGTDRDFTARIGKARAAFIMLKKIWVSGGISMRTKLSILNSSVKSVLLYECETWQTTQTMQQKIQTFFNTCLRHVYKIWWQEKIRNEDLRWVSGTGTSGQADTAEEVGLDRTHPQEANIQHHTPSPDLEPAGEEEERHPLQQLEARHWSSKGPTGWSGLSSPDQSAMVRGRRWPMLHRKRWASVSKWLRTWWHCDCRSSGSVITLWS